MADGYPSEADAICGPAHEHDRQHESREPEPEIRYIRQAAEQLSDLVNDLLDLAKVEAGKSVVGPARFEVQKLFGALRGMLRPLLLNQSVALVFDYPDDLPPLFTDEAKLSQILRNLISNALKFTERGEVRVSAAPPAADGTITFAVADTGIGIAAEDQERIFDEFAQLEHGLQQRVRGTGLGLPLAKRLASLLGGELTLTSEPAVGSTFRLVVPAQYVAPARDTAPFEWVPDAGRLTLLVIDDAPDAQYVYQKVLRNSAYQIYPAYTVHEAERALQQIVPAAVILDIVLQGESAWDLLLRMRRAEQTSHTPIIVVSSASERSKAFALGADAYLSKPVDRRTLLDTLDDLQARPSKAVRVLVVDDEEIARFLLRQAAASGSSDTHSPAWAGTRQFLEELSISRAQQGFSPSETATFVFSLKYALFDAIRSRLGRAPDAAADGIVEISRVLDSLGLFTTEVFQRGREQIIVRQQQELMELSTPVVMLWEGVLALPVIGTLDSARTQVVMESLLERIVSTGAAIAIIDITGVPTVDTLTAQHLLKTVAAARLMGADCIISGIRPQIAQTIVHLGVELGSVVTKATLADAFAVALRRSGLSVVKVPPAGRRSAHGEDPEAGAGRNEG